jgi:hypothetical protein
MVHRSGRNRCGRDPWHGRSLARIRRCSFGKVALRLRDRPPPACMRALWKERARASIARRRAPRGIGARLAVTTELQAAARVWRDLPSAAPSRVFQLVRRLDEALERALLPVQTVTASP